MLFTDDEQLEALNELMSERGYLDGSRMANVFNMLRPRDLIWPYIVNNYLLGQEAVPVRPAVLEPGFDADGGGQPQLLSERVLRREPPRQEEMTLAGTRLDIGKVKLPVYELATKEDHIAPAKSVFIGAQLFGGPVEFVLSGSGHIAGVVNPPDKIKYQYWTNPKPEKSLDTWLRDRARSIPAPGGRTGPSGSPSIPATGSRRASPAACSASSRMRPAPTSRPSTE